MNETKETEQVRAKILKHGHGQWPFKLPFFATFQRAEHIHSMQPTHHLKFLHICFISFSLLNQELLDDEGKTVDAHTRFFEENVLIKKPSNESETEQGLGQPLMSDFINTSN